ncbi:restriction endonuclease subunit S [uncultured Lamprocystis sp.]|jgi:type I restriction enzyme S subunit|uniref:restriction endonuclease subunit S n=1 Tax=uncultured Lamprocystis sp. TaxID=543132 RepID=UPI0025ED3F65|nr:restriction endonuclease subunit S [uncultured Lamprocystis sp.]
MIFDPSDQEQRLKWVFSSCKNGAWGTEPDGETDVVCIRAADFDGRRGRLNGGERTLRSIDPEIYEKLALRSGDIILEKSGGGEKQLVGRAVLFDGEEPSITSNFLARCRPAPDMEPAFINYLLLAIYEARGTFPHLKQSTGIQNLDLGSFLDIRVKIPPLGTQRRIARFLDEKTARIDGLIRKMSGPGPTSIVQNDPSNSSEKSLLGLLLEYRAAVITAAVTGQIGELNGD